MKKFEKLLERSLKVAALLSKGGKIDEKVKADISSFGTALLHNGLMPAIALYSDSSSISGKRRVQLLNAVYLVLNQDQHLPDALSKIKTQLLNHALACNPDQRAKLRSDIMDAAMAMKLAIRTFELESISHD
ncbi:MAG: hypothetical protein IPP06_09580 [Saprospiraceae bacterium]|nr:hypothetical protein [Candidatus Vicinibacter affinis]